MPHNVIIPAVGESITEGTVARWLVQDGAIVADTTPLFELETDKISTEVQAGAAGQVKLKVKEGDVVAVGGVVAEIDPAKAGATRAPPPPARPAEGASVRAAPVDPKAKDTGRSRSEPAPLSP